MVELFIANKNYSSWSLRPWVLLRQLGIPFEERLLIFGQSSTWDPFRRVCPTGKVPCLVDHDGDVRHGSSELARETVVWDSLAITEYLAERHRGVWASDPVARAFSRCAAAEMHAGFATLRERCSMNCGVRIRLHEITPALERDMVRVAAVWSEGLSRFSGPFLAGPDFTAVDAFFAPVAFRVQTYGLTLPPPAAAYAERLLALPAMRTWYEAALAETYRDEAHESEIGQFGTLLQDLRAV